VVGYAVYVGTVSGSYDEVFVVGNRTYFTYANAVSDLPYYFSVVAYTDGLVSGPSQEVAGRGQSTPALPVVGDRAAPNALNAITPNAPRTRTCTDVGRLNCTGTSVVAVAGVVEAIAPTGDGRFWIVENGRRVRMFDGQSLLREAALSAPPAVTFLGIAVDPRVEQRSRVYVAEAERRVDGTRDVRIVRYREVQSTLGERAVIVTGIQLPASGNAPFTIDPNGRIFVAVPSLQPNLPASVVLGFESDGSALRNNRTASPVVASTALMPSSLTWDTVDQLWLTGLRGTELAVALVPTSATVSDSWPRVPYPVAAVSPDRLAQSLSQSQTSETTRTVLLRMAAGRRVIQVIPGRDEFAEDPTFANQETTATATDRETRSSYVVTRSSGGAVTYIYKTDD